MASVYLGYDLELERLVAIKLLGEHLADDEAFRGRFLREARMAARLGHPNVVQVYDVGEEAGTPYIVMEYVAGGTLAEVRAGGTLRPDRVVDLALQVCAGLEHAHLAGLVHRDLKPQNLLLGGDDTVKIADFGIARADGATKVTEVGTVLGTAAYLAPEQAAGWDITPAADIYSLGVVLYELLTGQTPFRFESLVELVRKQREESITPARDLAPGVSERLDRIVASCLALDPAERPSAADLARQLAAASPEPPTVPLPEAASVPPTEILMPTRALTLRLRTERRPQAQAVPAPPRSWRRALFSTPRRQLWLAVGGIAALLTIGLVVALGSNGTDGQPPDDRRVVSPVPPASDPAQQARNLAEWVRTYSR